MVKDLPTGAKEQITSLVCTPLILRVMHVKRQKGSNNCMAFATTLLRMLGGCLYNAQRGTI